MARPLRLEFPGALYHITARGNAQQPIYLDDADRQRFLRLVAQEIRQQHWRGYVYCLMDNYYYLVVQTPQPTLSRRLRRLHGTYTQWFNRRHRRVGNVFQGRFKSLLIEKENSLEELCRYGADMGGQFLLALLLANQEGEGANSRTDHGFR